MQSDQNSGLCMLSFDVEDWFQVERLRPAIARDDWDNCELRVVANMEKLLAILKRHHTRATFFVLGWIAERVPTLVSRIQSEGHEIASHGYGHELLYHLSEEEFEKDILKSKNILERLTATEVIGYRAPGCSVVDYVPEILSRHGFRYDSSLFPSSFNNRYGAIGIQKIGDGISIGRLHNGLLEVPVATLEFLGRRFPWGGGGYFRFYPYWLFRAGIRAFLKRRTGYLFYGHPWDLDPLQPRVDHISWMDRFLHYSFLSMTEAKLERLLEDFQFVPVREGLEKLGLL